MSSLTPCYLGVLEFSFEEFRKCATNACRVTTNGSELASFVVPVALVSRLSPILAALVESERDSKNDVLTLEAVNDDTFWRFFQFVFSGTYESQGHIESAGTKRAAEVASDTAGNSLKTPEKIHGANDTAGGSGMFGAPSRPLTDTGGSLFGTWGMSGSASNSMVGVTKNRDTTMVNGSCWSLGSGSPFGAAQSLPKSRSPYSIVSKMMTLDTHSGPKVRCKRKRATSDDGEDLGKHSETQQHCISLFLKKYGIDEHKFQANGTNGTATMPTIISTFLSHCRMWHFAYTYAIPTLMDYACSQLALELAHFVIRATLFVPVFKRLVQFVYKECDTRDSSLRLLIAGFAACVIEDVSRLEGWRGLLTDVPAFKADLGNELLHAMETL